MRPRSTVAAIAAVALCALLVVPGAFAETVGAPASTAVQFSSGTGAATSLPAALAAPWAARAGYDPSWSAEVSDQGAMTGTATVVISLFPRDLSLFDGTQGLGAPLSLAAFQARFSPTPTEYAAFESYFEHSGLNVTHTFADRMSLTVSGPAQRLGPAFSTSLVGGDWRGQPVHFPTSLPTLPADLQSSVAAVTGLSDGFTRFTIPFARMSLPSPSGAGIAPAQGRSDSLVTPDAVHSIYQLDALYNFSGRTHFASSQSIALVLWGDGYDPSDISSFYSNYYPSGFPLPKVYAVPVDGAPQPSAGAVNDPSQAPLELTLDLEWSGSIAPGASLYAVYAPDGSASNGYSPTDASLEDALNTAIGEPGVHVVSMSFATEAGADPSFEAAFETSFQSALARGITPVAASGDNGGTNNDKGACTNTAQPEFPAASPLVVAAGGTDPTLSQSLTGGVTGLSSEPAWKDSGGGFAPEYSAPSWQLQGSARSPISSNGHRGIPDVAGPAAYNFLYFGGQPGAGNGTSFAAPIWGGILAEMDAIRGTPFGFVTPHLYSVGAREPSGSVAQGLIDITSGANCLGPAGTGWDTATGWGSPRAGLLYQDLSSSYVLVNLTAASSAVAPGGSFTARVTILNSTSHAPITGVPVNVTLTAPGYLGPCGGTLSSTNGTTDATGSTQVQVSVPACYFGTHATVTATVLALGLFGSNTTSVSVNLLGLAGFLAFLQTYPYNLFLFVVIVAVAGGVGWVAGSRRRRRRALRATREAAAVPASVAAAPTMGPPGPGPPLPPETEAGGYPAVEPAPPMGAPAPGAAESTGSVTCPICKFEFEPEFDFCPRCGHYLPGRSGDPEAGPPSTG
ncbi:MAG TPA: S8 family serine peptidase [Thermoplasmata archaeon]|nr:S8 family serine peptidase [Thermoplasmata archaeon]